MANESVKPSRLKKHTDKTTVVKDYGNDPYFVKKTDESQKFLEKYGFPKGIGMSK